MTNDTKLQDTFDDSLPLGCRIFGYLRGVHVLRSGAITADGASGKSNLTTRSTKNRPRTARLAAILVEFCSALALVSFLQPSRENLSPHP